MQIDSERSSGSENPHKQLDLKNPIDLAQFEYELASYRGPLPPALRFLMNLPLPELKIFVEDFAREFDLNTPTEIHFQAWERLNIGHGPGWFAICAYNYFSSITQSGMEFIAYVYARYGKGLPPGSNPGLMTRVRSLWSEVARLELDDQEKTRDVLCAIRDRVHGQVFKVESACDPAINTPVVIKRAGLKVREPSQPKPRIRQGV